MWLAAGSTARAPNRHRWLSRCAQPRRRSARGPRRSEPRRVCRSGARALRSNRSSVPRSAPRARSPGLRRRRAGIATAPQTPPEFGAATPSGGCPPPRTGNCARSEERRVGEEGRSRGAPDHLKKKKKKIKKHRSVKKTEEKKKIQTKIQR